MGTTGQELRSIAARELTKRARHEGARFRAAVVKDETSLSFCVSPSATGYTLRARKKSPHGGKVAVEHFSEAQYGDSFAAAKKRALELKAVALAERGWSEKRSSLTIEDLL